MNGFKSGTLITTDKGLIPIEKLKVGDLVLTHTNKYQKILEINKEYVEGCYKLQTQGSPTTFIGKDQVLSCVEKVKQEYNKETNQSERVFSNRKSKTINKMGKNDFICIGKNTKRAAQYTNIEIWVLGKFINKGSLDFNKKTITLNISKENKRLKTRLKNFDYEMKELKNSIKIIIKNEDKLFELCRYFYNNGNLPLHFMEMPDSLLKEFLSSLCLESAKFTEDEYYILKSTNKMFIYQLGQIVSNINSYGGFSLFWEDTKVPSYRIQFKDHVPKSANFVRIKNILWQPIREVVEWRAFRGTLFALVVENDKSYVANGIVVKC